MLLSFLLIFATLTRSYQQETRSEPQVLTGRGAEGLSRIPHLGLAGAAASEAVRGARAATKVPGKKRLGRKISDSARGDFRKAECGRVGESDPGEVRFAVVFV